MQALTMTFTEQRDRLLITRSDGVPFVLRWHSTGAAVLYQIPHDVEVPAWGMVEFALNVADKLDAARRYVLAWPETPVET